MNKENFKILVAEKIAAIKSEALSADDEQQTVNDICLIFDTIVDRYQRIVETLMSRGNQV